MARILKRLRKLWSAPGLVGTVIFGVSVGRLLQIGGDLDFIRTSATWLWQQLNTVNRQIIAFFIGIALIIWALFRDEKQQEHMDSTPSMTPTKSSAVPVSSTTPMTCTNPLHAELQRIYEEDRRFLKERVKLIKCDINRQSDPGQAYPFVEFRFRFINVAVFPIMIGSQITEGNIRCLNEYIPAPSVTEGHKTKYPHGSEITLVLRQSFTREFVTRMNELAKRGSALQVDFQELTIPILDEGEQVAVLELGVQHFYNLTL